MSDKLQHECAVAAVFGTRSAAVLTVKLLYMLQHRGPQASGIASWDGEVPILYKRPGLVRSIFGPTVVEKLTGRVAIGHNRYSTCGGNDDVAIQPHIVDNIVGASNGDVPRYTYLRQWLLDKKCELKSHNDGEAIVALVAYHLRQSLEPLEAIRATMGHPDLEGAAYSCVFIINGELWAFRDPYGIRPLALGRSGTMYVVASETNAFRIVNVTYIRDIAPGEIYRINASGGEGFPGPSVPERRQCVFELIYFAYPGSKVFGISVSDFRKQLGAQLGELYRNVITADPSEYVVVSVPDSANSIGLGFARSSGLPLDFGLLRGHFAGRGFLEDDQAKRDDTAIFKYNPDPAVVSGKRVILVDDSIVRSTTMRKLVRMIRGAGAVEVIILIGSPPVVSQCFFGINTPTRSELIATSKSVEEIRLKIEADVLRYLSIPALRCCLPENGKHFCLGCFDPDTYPCLDRIPGEKFQA